MLKRDPSIQANYIFTAQVENLQTPLPVIDHECIIWVININILYLQYMRYLENLKNLASHKLSQMSVVYAFANIKFSFIVIAEERR